MSPGDTPTLCFVSLLAEDKSSEDGLLQVKWMMRRLASACIHWDHAWFASSADACVCIRVPSRDRSWRQRVTRIFR